MMSSNRSPEVDAWFEGYGNPQKTLMQTVRQAVLEADPRVEEVIKWQAPTFTFQGNIASFFPKTKSHVALMFHTGASLDDPTGLLEGDGAVTRVARFADEVDFETKRLALQILIRTWVSDHEGVA